METESNAQAAVRELPIVAGHLALDFANTVDDPLGPARFDHAATYADLVRWATRTQVITRARASRLLRTAADHPQDAAVATTSAHELRDALNQTFGAVADGAADTPKQWTRLRPFVATPWPPRPSTTPTRLPRTGPGGRPTTSPSSSTRSPRPQRTCW